MIITNWHVVATRVPSSKVGEVVDIPFLCALLEPTGEWRIHLSVHGVPLSKAMKVQFAGLNYEC
jgi:hypothetical protein